MKNLRTSVPEETFAALEAEAVAQGKTLAALVRRLLDAHVGASPSTEHTVRTLGGETLTVQPAETEHLLARLDKQAIAIKALRSDRDLMLLRIDRLERQ